MNRIWRSNRHAVGAVVSRPGLSGKLLANSSETGKERLAYLANATASIRADRALLEST